MKDIKEFRDEYYFLSNFYPCKICMELGGKHLEFNSSEAMFHALKCPTRAEEFVGLNPSDAKRLGRKVNLRDNWDEIKVPVIMPFVLKSKFDQNEDLKYKLLKTEGCHLEEGNDWNDKFWGTVKGEGNNYLGICLMNLRDDYIKENKIKAMIADCKSQ